jgi:GrpB-like predicted nucleotidyltransferase (UPF0157 family)
MTMCDLSEASAGGDPIAVVPYDARWPALFDAEAVRLADLLGETAVRIEHIGSTAVRGLAAKPVIDIQISVPALDPATPYADPLEGLGYGSWRDVHEPDHRFCRDEPRRHHIHLVVAGGAIERDRPLFRDYLIANPRITEDYAVLKIRAAATHGHDRDAYTLSKSEFIETALREARVWARERHWRLA